MTKQAGKVRLSRGFVLPAGQTFEEACDLVMSLGHARHRGRFLTGGH